jgi:hypothetical protein
VHEQKSQGQKNQLGDLVGIEETRLLDEIFGLALGEKDGGGLGDAEAQQSDGNEGEVHRGGVGCSRLQSNVFMLRAIE